MSETATELRIVRTFNAPRESVFKAFESCEAMCQWWGPKGSEVTKCDLDFKPGGILHYNMHHPNGMLLWGRFVYQEIVRPEKIVYVSSFSDEAGNITRGPFFPDWPEQVLNTLTLTGEGGKTTLTLVGHPINAAENEIQLFESQVKGMQGGFGGTLDRLEQFLAQEVER